MPKPNPKHKKKTSQPKSTFNWPGEDKYERRKMSRQFCRYLNRNNFPHEDRKETNPNYTGLRDVWIQGYFTKKEQLRMKQEMEQFQQNISTEGQVPSAPQGIRTETPGMGSTVKSNKQTQAIQRIAQKTKRGGKTMPPPTGFHSTLSIEDWLVYYIPHHFEGPPVSKKKLQKTIFQIIQETHSQGQQTTLPSPNSPKKKRKPQLYKVQQEMLKHFMQHPWAAVEVFRSAGKTQLVLGLIVYVICENPAIRIALLSEEYKKTVQRVRVVRKLLASPKIIEDYGYLINDSSGANRGKNTEGMFECYRDTSNIEPTLMAITWKDAQALGYHYDGVVLDDPWSGKLQNTKGAMDKWLDWWGEFRFSLEQVQFCWMLRTKKGYHDLYTKLDEMKRWQLFKIPLVQKLPLDGTYDFIENSEGIITKVVVNGSDGIDYQIYDTCFGKYSIENILLLRHENPFYYERELQNNPHMLTGNIFRVDNINRFNTATSDPIVQGFIRQQASVQYVKMMDMSFGESDEADYNVLLILGRYRNRLFLVDAWFGRWTFRARLRAIQEAEEKWPGIPLYIEKDFGQNAIIKEIRYHLPGLKIRSFTSKGKGLNYKDLYMGQPKAGKKGKIHDSLVVPISDGRLYVVDNLPGWNMLEQQLISFPNCDYFDYIDTLSMANIVLGPRQQSSMAIFS